MSHVGSFPALPPASTPPPPLLPPGPAHGQQGQHGHQGHHGRALTIVGILVVLLSALAVGGLVLRKHLVVKHEAEARSKEVDRGPHILVSKAVMSPARNELTLPAETRGYFQTTAYAKVSGYVRDVRVDKGDHVKKGQILATIESPETDQVVRGAASDLALRKQLQARAQLLAPNVMSAQDLETATSNMVISSSSMKSALALQSYETIRAPFDGIVTMRYVDPGALLPAATGSTSSAQPLLDVADAAKLRIDAYVGQESAGLVQLGTPVSIWQADPNKRVETKVTRVAGALDPRTRTMLCEIELDNARAHFLPGTFSHVTFHIDTPSLPVIPSEALMVRQGDDVVGVVENGHIRMTKVTPGVTDGRTMQIVSGLHGGEMIALNMPAETGDGAAVQATEKPPASAPGAEPGKGGEGADGGAGSGGGGEGAAKAH